MVELVVGGMATTLFGYNRTSYMFDRQQQQHREYWGQQMRLKRFELYREDVRDLMDLTVGKMDTYLIVNALQLTFCVYLLTEGRPTPGVQPKWMMWLYSVHISGAVLYLVLSIWLGMHASIAAHSFGVRMLTQFVRLPVPTRDEINAARFRAVDYEGKEVAEMMRVPVLQQQLRNMSAAMDGMEVPSQGEDGGEVLPPVTDAMPRTGETAMGLEHTKLWRQLQANWQAYDAYSRVCMAMGTIQLLAGVGYFALGLTQAEFGCPEAAFGCLAMLFTSAWLVLQLDLYSSRVVLSIGAFLVLTPPLISLVVITLSMLKPSYHWASNHLKEIDERGGGAFIFSINTLWLVYSIWVAKAEQVGEVAIPCKLRSILYLDVFGAIAEHRQHQLDAVAALRPQPPATPPCSPQASPVGSPPSGSYRPSSMPPAIDLLPETDFEDVPVGATRSSSSTAPGLARQASTGDDSPDSGMRRSLMTLCLRLKTQIQQDLRRWESASLAAVADDEFTHMEVARLHREYEKVEDQLFAALGEVPDSGQGHELQAASAEQVWLKLQYQPSGLIMEFFYNTDTGATVWEPPQTPARISDLALLAKHIEMLSDKVTALVELQHQQHPRPIRGFGTSLAGHSAPVSFRPPPGPTLGLGGSEQLRTPNFSLHEEPQTPVPQGSLLHASTCTPLLTPGVVGSVATDNLQLASRSQPDPSPVARVPHQHSTDSPLLSRPLSALGSLAQEHAASVQLSEGINRTSGRLLRRDENNEARIQAFRDERVRGRRPPGLMPWYTYLYGTLLLLAVWTMGTIWQIFHVPDYIHSADAPKLMQVPVDFFAHLPNLGPFSRPIGLTCHPGLPTQVLVAEKFALHHFHRTDTGVSLSSQKLTWLGAAEGFQATGLRGASLACANSTCSAVLVGSTGRTLQRSEFGENHSSDDVLELRGGPWQDVSLSFSEGSAPRLWAIGAGSLVHLGPSRSKPGVFVPRFELGSGLSDSARVLSLADRGEVLTLEPNGTLRAWPRGTSGRPHGQRWLQAPNQEPLQWLGLCELPGNELLLLAFQPSSGSASLWSSKLSQDVTELTPTLSGKGA